MNYFRKTFKTVSNAEEEFSIDYEDICTTNISDDSGFIEVSTPSTPATPYRQREDSSIFTAGRAFLPAKNRQSIRQRLFRVDVGLPPVPENQQVLKLA